MKFLRNALFCICLLAPLAGCSNDGTDQTTTRDNLSSTPDNNMSQGADQVRGIDGKSDLNGGTTGTDTGATGISGYTTSTGGTGGTSGTTG